MRRVTSKPPGWQNQMAEDKKKSPVKKPLTPSQQLQNALMSLEEYVHQEGVEAQEVEGQIEMAAWDLGYQVGLGVEDRVSEPPDWLMFLGKAKHVDVSGEFAAGHEAGAEVRTKESRRTERLPKYVVHGGRGRLPPQSPPQLRDEDEEPPMGPKRSKAIGHLDEVYYDPTDEPPVGRQRLMVYGTAKGGEVNAWRLGGAKLLGRVALPGYTRRDVMERSPAIEPGDETDVVEGELYEVDPNALLQLDAYEGVDWVRREVTLDDGSRAWVYVHRQGAPNIDERLSVPQYIAEKRAASPYRGMTIGARMKEGAIQGVRRGLFPMGVKAARVAGRFAGSLAGGAEGAEAADRAIGATARAVRHPDAPAAPKQIEGLPRGERIPHSQVQTLLFDREVFDVSEAKAWAREHGFRYGKVDDNKPLIRIRQRDPDEFLNDTFGTITLREGIQAVVAVPADRAGDVERLEHVRGAPYPGESIGEYQRREHTEARGLLAQVITALRRDDREAADVAFREFVADLIPHIEYEESTLYPEWLAKHPADERIMITRFLQAHRRIRLAIDRMDTASEDGLYDAESLARRLANHAADEEGLWPVR